MLASIFASSCSNEEVIENGTSASAPVNDVLLEETTAQQEFAMILSKAVASNQSLREFLKKEAVKEFDNNFDIFYPYARNKKIDEQHTFRDVLVENSSEAEIKKIESSLPLLTIFIPDLSMFNAFNVKTWDTAEGEVFVSYDKDNNQSVFYENGQEEIELKTGELPDFPFLMVKSTNRMRVVNRTRTAQGEELEYDYADEAFRPKSATRSHNHYKDFDNGTAAKEPYVPAEELDPLVIEAYNKKTEKSLDRDYIYYGLCEEKPTNGELRANVREKLLRFRVNPNCLDQISDGKSDLDGDPYLEREVYHQKSELSIDEVIKRIWHDGTFEFRVYTCLGDKKGHITISKLTLSYPASELFHVDKIHLRHVHATGFRHSRNHYTVEIKDLSSKWVDLSDRHLYTIDEPWNLNEKSVTAWLVICEYDDGASKERTMTQTSSFAITTSTSTETAISGSSKMTAGVSTTASNGYEKKVKINFTNTTDSLGTVALNFVDPVIISKVDSPEPIYKMKTYDTGVFEMIIVPERERK